ncbi:MAG: hypothetical protein OJF50_000197 [Nitrospira sp.]|nr:hypothetical protein [Nitrospira sp.]
MIAHVAAAGAPQAKMVGSACFSLGRKAAVLQWMRPLLSSHRVWR